MGMKALSMDASWGLQRRGAPTLKKKWVDGVIRVILYFLLSLEASKAGIV